MLSIVRKVCELYSTGNYTMENCCENAGVPYRTFRNWWNMYDRQGSIDGSKWAILAEVADLWTASQSEMIKGREQKLVERAELMLLKRIEGYFYETSETIVKAQNDGNGNDILIPVAIKKIKKYAHPSDKLIQFVLTKLCPKKYGDQDFYMNTQISMNPYENYSLEEIEAEIKKLQQDLSIVDD